MKFYFPSKYLARHWTLASLSFVALGLTMCGGLYPVQTGLYDAWSIKDGVLEWLSNYTGRARPFCTMQVSLAHQDAEMTTVNVQQEARRVLGQTLRTARSTLPNMSWRAAAVMILSYQLETNRLLRMLLAVGIFQSSI